MATGDMKNNLKKLQAGLKSLKYEKDVDIESLSKGIPAAFLPIYHFAFIDFSRHVAEKISELNIELYGKSDLRFVEGMYKVLREIFTYKPPLTKDQFFSNGFAEKKVIMCTAIINQVIRLHTKLAPKPRPKTAPTNMTSTPLVTSAVGAAINHKTQVPTSKSTTDQITAKPPPGPKQTTVSSQPQGVLPRNAVFSNISESKQSAVPNIQVQNELHEMKNTAVTVTRSAPSNVRIMCHEPKPPMGNGHSPLPDFVTPQVLASPVPYNPATYSTRDDIPKADRAHVEMQPQNVEIVSLDSDTSDDMHLNLRPIDTIPKTPGRSLIESHVQRSDPQAVNTSQNLVQVVEEKLTGVAQNVNRLLERMTTLEEKMVTLENQQRESTLSKETIENILARLTLVENNFQLVKAQINPQTSTRHDETEPDSLEIDVSHISASKRPHIVQSFNDENLQSVPTMTSTPLEPLPTQRDCTKEISLPQADRIKAMLKDTANMLNINVMESPLKTPVVASENIMRDVKK